VPTPHDKADDGSIGALTRRRLLGLARELGWGDAECWRTARLMGSSSPSDVV
jgi:hypothetical protein